LHPELLEVRMHTLEPALQPERTVAVLGAGPAGLTCARWLKHCGFDPILFEASEQLGGQWNPASPMSGTWRGMRTNTSRILSAFSDIEHAPGTAVYPRQDDVLAYLHRYAERFGIAPSIRLNTQVELLEQWNDGWLIRSIASGARRSEIFRRVVVATGRHVAPDVPHIPGIETFAGSLGVAHTNQYNGAERYREKDVVVLGCSISALEISADLALAGARAVTTACRRPRYILPKVIAGVPTDHVIFTRAAALAAETTPPEALAAALKNVVLRAAGNPAQYGAPAPDENIFAAGIAQSQHFLAAVAEGRITMRSAIARIENRTVHFSDGTTMQPDALLFGTGYRLSLPWLAPALAAVLRVDGSHIDLHEHTFHPELPGLAFLGLYDQVGPLLPVLELQARWISYAFSGVRPAPTRAEMLEGLARCRAARGGPKNVLMHAMALLFARQVGAEPDLARWPELQRALLFGPLSPVSFRLQGPDSLADAPARTGANAAAFGAISSPHLSQEEQDTLSTILSSRPRAA
jgi:dimethylaniline monooxygenase (N-oxide forming)